MSRLYLIGAAIVAVGLAYFAVDASAYKRGKTACMEAQASANADHYQKVIKEMQDAGVDLNDTDAVDCELRRLAGEPASENCGDL